MAITWDTATASGGSNGGANGTRDITHTVGAGANGVLYVVVAYSDKSGGAGTTVITGMNWDQSGTPTALTILGASPYRKASGLLDVWRLKAPVTGAKTLRVSWTATSNDPLIVHVFSAQGVDQTTPEHNFNSANGTGTGVTVAITSASGEDVVDAGMLPESAGSITTGGTAEFANTTSTANGDPVRLGTQRTNGAATVNTSWTGQAGNFWLDVGFSVVPAASSASQWGQQTSDQWNRIVQGAQ